MAVLHQSTSYRITEFQDGIDISNRPPVLLANCDSWTTLDTSTDAKPPFSCKVNIHTKREKQMEYCKRNNQVVWRRQQVNSTTQAITGTWL